MVDIFTADEVLELAQQIDSYIFDVRKNSSFSPVGGIEEWGVNQITRLLTAKVSPDFALKKLSTLTGPYGSYNNIKFIFKRSFKSMPKFINDTSMKKVIALWRLSVGK
jgi:hypothetical protein